MTYIADPRPIRVVTGDGKFLFSYDPSTRTIEIKERGLVFKIPMWLIEEHLRTSQRDILRVYEEYETSLPCGHTEGTVLDMNQNLVCPVCGQ